MDGTRLRTSLVLARRPAGVAADRARLAARLVGRWLAGASAAVIAARTRPALLVLACLALVGRHGTAPVHRAYRSVSEIRSRARVVLATCVATTVRQDLAGQRCWNAELPSRSHRDERVFRRVVRFAPVRRDLLAWERLPPRLEAARFGFLPRPLPDFLPPLSSLFTVAYAICFARFDDVPLFLALFSMCDARRFCLLVYFALLPVGMRASW
jgi:hypothetical protein